MIRVWSRSYWSSLFVAILLLGVVVCADIYYYTQELSQQRTEDWLGGSLAYFMLINLNIIFVMVLGFVVSKNIFKFVMDRRRRVVGTRLRSRLVMAFVGLSLIPTVLLLFVATGILKTVMQGWFSPQIETSVNGALAVAQHHYALQETRVSREAQQIAAELQRLLPYLIDDLDHLSLLNNVESRTLLYEHMEAKRSEYGLFEVVLVDDSQKLHLQAASPELYEGVVDVPGLNLASLHRLFEGEVHAGPEQSITGEFMRSYAPVTIGVFLSAAETSLAGDDAAADIDTLLDEGSPRGGSIAAVLPKYGIVVTSWIPPELNETLSDIITAYDDYRQLNIYHRPLASSYFLTLASVAMLVVLAAMWIGFYLARSLAVPIQQLAEGTAQVARGNLDIQLPETGDDELGILVRSFNKMTTDLKQTTRELVSRRRYMETVLASLGIGVVSIDIEGRITTLNIAAGNMLGFEQTGAVVNKHISSVFPSSLAAKVTSMLEELYSSPEKMFTTSMSLEFEQTTKQIQITVNKLLNDAGRTLGAVVLLDDLTELVSAQRMAAWREVARRIAHEIKNPLTPIQLSAQRMRRKFASRDKGENKLSPEEQKVINDSTETIVSQVETMRTLVNEFSRFAKMPKSNPRPTELNPLIISASRIFESSNPDLLFEYLLDDNLPVINLDAEEIKRVLINLVDNAVRSVNEAIEKKDASVPKGESAAKMLEIQGKSFAQETENRVSEIFDPFDGFKGRITLKSSVNEALGLVSIAVSDNGLGVSDQDKPKLFEPYFTSRRGGTGLGLAIVNTVVADHNGFIRVRDNEDGGATFVIELPVERESAHHSIERQA